MKVKKLIEILKQCNPEYEIYWVDDYYIGEPYVEDAFSLNYNSQNYVFTEDCYDEFQSDKEDNDLPDFKVNCIVIGGA